MVAQRGATRQGFEEFEAGWRYPNYTWVQPTERVCGEVDGTWEKTQGRFKPCLFDLEADPREEHDLSQEQPEVLSRLYKALNDTWRTYYYSRSPDALLGHCDVTCANKRWVSLGGISGHGPTCGVPGCRAPAPAPPSSDCQWLNGTGLAGHSLGILAASSKEACCGACRATAGCKAANWNTHNSEKAMCHLKDTDSTYAVSWGGLSCVPGQDYYTV